ncbi:hypothetical protein Bca4012_077517 [Brassica carinata]|uniref:Uncharacterized protein n=1 Tax=Brassica carinata TaxID=52824 RepID=A0A8X8B3D3_BRACI|nr:hypothetical protein Bca52824_014373 [Brassica carinata]
MSRSKAGETTITRLVPSNSNSNLESVKTEPGRGVCGTFCCCQLSEDRKEIIQGSGHWWGRSPGQSLGYLACSGIDSVTFDASEVLVAAGAASQHNRSRKRKELDKKIKGCGGMARKKCFLRLNVKGWSSSKEFIDKEVYKDLADVEVKLGELEAELSETIVVNDKLQRSYNELPIDPTKQVKLGFLNGLVPRDKSMVFERILFRAPMVTS